MLILPLLRNLPLGSWGPLNPDLMCGEDLPGMAAVGWDPTSEAPDCPGAAQLF